MRSPIWLSALAAGAVLAPAAQAGPLTFDEAVARADADSPGLRAAALQIESARAAARAAGALPDPQLKVGVENYPVSGPMAGRLGEEPMTMAVVGVMQEIPNRARRQAEAGLARAEISAAQARRLLEQRRARTGAATAWLDLHFAQQRLAAVDEVLEQLGPLWDAAPSAVASGASRPAAALSPVRMRAELEDRRSELAAAVGKARAELVRWTGDPSPSVVGPAPQLDLDPAALRAALPDLPTLLAYDSAAERARGALDLAKAAKRPDWALEASYGRRDPRFGDMVSIGVSVRLPLFAASRQDPLIAARTADAARVGAEREAARRELAAALEADLAGHAMHHEQWARARDVVLPAARRQADLETASYAAGRADLEAVVEAFTALADAQLAVLDREAAMARDNARIAITYGSEAR